MLLLDEPLGALDLKLRKQMQLELKRIQTEVNITFIHVTHDQEEAMTMADRIAVMNQGQDRADRPAGRAVRAAEHGLRRRLPGRQQPAQRDGLRQRRGDSLPTAASPGSSGRAAGAPQEVRIGVRPEKVRLEAGAGPRPRNGANQLTGTVRDVSYIGVSTQYIVDTQAGDEIVVFAQNAGRSIDQLRNGDGVRILWDPEHTFVITDSGEVPSVEELV